MNFKGFTLVETIIYTALLGVVLTGFISFALAISSLKVKNHVIAEVNANARTAMQIISQKIKSAQSISSPSPGNIDSGLILEMRNESFSRIEMNDEILSIKEGGGQFVPIVSSEILISDLSFYNLSTGVNDENLKISFTINYKNSSSTEYNYQQDLQTAVSLR